MGGEGGEGRGERLENTKSVRNVFPRLSQKKTIESTRCEKFTQFTLQVEREELVDACTCVAQQEELLSRITEAIARVSTSVGFYLDKSLGHGSTLLINFDKVRSASDGDRNSMAPSLANKRLLRPHLRSISLSLSFSFSSCVTLL